MKWGERALLIGCPAAYCGLGVVIGISKMIFAISNLPKTIKAGIVGSESANAAAGKELLTAIGGAAIAEEKYPEAALRALQMPAGIDFDFITRWLPVLILIWLARVLYVLQVEKKGPRPFSWSMGGLPACGTDFVGMTISNVIAAVVGLWVLSFFHDLPTAMILFLGAAGGQIAEFAAAMQLRWQVLEARDQIMHGEAMQQHVSVSSTSAEDEPFHEVF